MKLKREKNPLILYGKNTVREVIENDWKNIEEFYFLSDAGKFTQDLKEFKEFAQKKKIKISFITNKIANEITNNRPHQNILIKIKKYQYAKFNQWIKKLDKKRPNLVLILDKIEDVGNFGAIIRSAAAVGVAGIIVPDHQQAPVNGTVFKTSAGTVNRVKIIRDINLNQAVERLKKEDFWIYAIDMEDKKKYKDGNIWEQKFDGNTAFILGNEGDGISQKLLEKADFITPIPMENEVESLNVSVSSAIAMFEWKRQQFFKNKDYD